MFDLSVTPESLAAITRRIVEASAVFHERYPGDSTDRQPVHSVYGGAQLYQAGSNLRLGSLALASMDEYAPNFAVFARALGLPNAETLPTAEPEIAALETKLAQHDGDPWAWLAQTIYTRVREKLRREPVEDQRIDFEDGYGYRSDDEEDGHASTVAEQLAQGMAGGTLPPFIGIRVKSLAVESLPRAVRTLDLVITGLAARAGALPPRFVVTLPKVMFPDQVSALADLLDVLERQHGLPTGAIKIDLMIETSQAIIDQLGASGIQQLVQAGGGRVVSVAFGTYDYTASCNITAGYQSHDHPAADFARHMLQASLAGTGVMLSDGATNVMPVGPRHVVHQAWRLHYQHVRHSLEGAFYQGWDLHPAQLPTRFAAIYSFFLESRGAASERLTNFIAKAAQATLVGDVFDDAATGQGLLNFFLRGIACGAIAEEEVLATGITLEELRGRSFVRILKNRRG
jgi:hypothetical protein